VKIGLVLIHFVLILTPVAIVGAEVPAVRAEVAAVAIDVALIGADDPTGAAEIRPILLNGGRITRRPILLKLLLVLSNGLPVAVALLPVGAEIPLVLPDVSRVLAHVLAVLAQVALPAPELAPLLLYLRIGNGSGGLRAGARGPDGQCNARGAPSTDDKSVAYVLGPEARLAHFVTRSARGGQPCYDAPTLQRRHSRGSQDA